MDARATPPRPLPGSIRAVTAALLLAPASAVGQVAGGSPAVPSAGGRMVTGGATVRVEENFRAEPNGTVIGRLMEGTTLEIVEQRGSWTRGTLRGFVWLPSLQARETGEFDLEISEPAGENLRDEAGGRVAARLLGGTLLEEVARVTGWVEVRRTAWVWAESLDLAGTPTPPAPPTAAPTTAVAPASTPNTPAGGGGTTTVVVPERAPDVAVGGWIRSGGGGIDLLSAPGGDTLGRTREGAELRVLGREGNWVRIQLDGWVWAPGAVVADATDAAAAPSVGEPAVVTSVPDVRRLTTDFATLRGRLVEVRLQFISLERAEQVRTDFYEGEPFLLMRSLDGERSFVYVAVPSERLAALGVLTPLETVRVVGRLRSGAAAFTGSPILDLVELERTR